MLRLTRSFASLAPPSGRAWGLGSRPEPPAGRPAEPDRPAGRGLRPGASAPRSPPPERARRERALRRDRNVIGIATTSIAWFLVLVLFIGWLVYAVFNAKAARKELGSEIELAANRKPYYDDEELEGRRLELVQFIGVLLLVVIVIGLPLYWVFEPSRQAALGRRPRPPRGRGAPSCSRPRPRGDSTAPAVTAR